MSSSTPSQRGASRRGATSTSSGKKGGTRRAPSSSKTASASRSSAKASPRTAPRKAAPRKPAARRLAGPLVPIAVVVALGVLGWALYPALKLQYQTSRRVAGLEQKYDSLRKRNETLRAEVAGLKTPEGIAKAAGEGLGFVKQGDNVYVVMPSKEPTSQAPGTVATKDERSAVQVVLDAVFGVEAPVSADNEP